MDPARRGTSEPIARSAHLHRGAVPPVTQLRGTLLTSSLLTLREHGLYDAYLTKLDPVHHDTVASLIAAQWLPLDVAVAHYRAIDALGLPPSTMNAMGDEVSARIQSSVLGSVLRGARSAGLGPWTLVESYARLCERIFVGGAVAAFKVGPKDAVFEVRGLPLLEIPYFRVACAALHRGSIGLLAKRVIVRELPGSSAARWVLRCAWM